MLSSDGGYAARSKSKGVQKMIIQGDCLERLKELQSQSVHCCVTSPPYWGLRDYGVEGQLGLESTPDEYVQKMVEVFREVKRVLRDDGTLWLNLGDSYAGSGKGFGGKDHGKLGNHANEFLPKPNELPGGLKPKDLVGIPWRVAFALQADGWYLRSDIIWHKPNPMPESVTDRPTKAHEYIFLLSKSERYYYDADAIREKHTRIPFGGNEGYGQSKKDQHLTSQSAVRDGKGRMGNHEEGRNKRTVWTVNTQPYSEAHFATFPPKLIEPCILAGCPIGGTVLDPFNGAGTTGLVAMQNDREYIGIELNPEYINITNDRLSHIQPVINF